MLKYVTCSGCGSYYRLTATRAFERDNDSISCEVCGQEIHSWSEAKFWSAELVKRGEPGTGS